MEKGKIADIMAKHVQFITLEDFILKLHQYNGWLVQEASFENHVFSISENDKRPMVCFKIQIYQPFDQKTHEEQLNGGE